MPQGEIEAELCLRGVMKKNIYNKTWMLVSHQGSRKGMYYKRSQVLDGREFETKRALVTIEEVET